MSGHAAPQKQRSETNQRDRSSRPSAAIASGRTFGERSGTTGAPFGSGATEWRRLAPELVETGSLTGADLRALELLAETLAIEAEMRALISAEGATIPASEGGKKGHPALKIATDARAQAIRLLESFGLTPSSRHRVDRAPAPPADDSPWSKLKALQAQSSNAPRSDDPAHAQGCPE